MPSVTFKCPNCSGPLKFDPDSGKYQCEFCQSLFDQATLDAIEASLRAKDEAAPRAEEPAQKRREEDAVLYTCPSCGAEIVTTATTAATQCYYCHNPVILSGRLSDGFKPDCVVPFKVDRDEAVRRFLDWTRKKRFVPRDFFSEKQIEKMTGVYYPYWLGDFNVDATFRGEGLIASSVITGQFTVVTTKHYEVIREGAVDLQNLVERALKSTDRALDDGIRPFDLSELRDFSMGYLSGFMAEKRDIEEGAAETAMQPEIERASRDLLEADARAGYTSVSGSANARVTGKRMRYALLPSWILTYAGRDKKTYYYAMNGQTGIICGNLPLDIKKLTLYCAAIGAFVTALLLLGGWLLW